MTNVLKVINSISDIAFIIIFIFVFFVSLEKCFLREGQSKVILFIIALLTNPITIFPVATITAVLID